MSLATRCAALSVLGCIAFLQAVGAKEVSKQQRPWTPRDSAAVRYIAFDRDIPTSWFAGGPNPQGVWDPDVWVHSPGRTQLGAVASPDARYFFTLSYHGDLQADTNVYTLQIFGAPETRALLAQKRRDGREHALAEVTFRSGRSDDIRVDHGSAIVNARWEPEGSAVLFRAISEQAHYEGYRLDVKTGAAEQLTDTPRGIEWFEYRAGRALYHVNYLLEQPLAFHYPVEAAYRRENGFVYPNSLQSLRVRNEYYTSRDERAEALEPFEAAAISPNGQMAMLFQPGPKPSFRLLKFDAGRSPQTLMSVEASAVPLGIERIFWSADSSQVVLIGVRPPNGAAGETSPAPDAGEVAVFGIGPASWQPLERIRSGELLQSVSWSETSGQLTLVHGARDGSTEQITHQLRAHRWVRQVQNHNAASAGQSSPFGTLEVEVRQSENDPPVLVASEGSRERVLMNPDPALKGVHRIRVQRFNWHDPDGSVRQGGLVLPQGYRPGRPVPIVIQPYHYVPEIFMPDGVSRTADAAQALAARGIAALIISTGDLMSRPSIPEGASIVARLDAVVDALVEQGITQPTQVAVIGFSRGAYDTYYAITHPGRTCLAAAIVADGFNGSYSSYLEAKARGSSGHFVGDGRSFWSDRQYWLDLEDTFNADRIATPALFAETSNETLVDNSINSLTTMGAFILNNKPIDYLYFKKAVHQLRTPLQRVAMMSSAVDWMAFWMLGEENPDPSRTMQNRRWRKLRDAWAGVKAKDFARGEAGFITTRSGLMYKITSRRSGVTPSAGDRITLHFIATLADGTEVENTYKSGKPRVVELSKSHMDESDPATDKADLKSLEEGLRLLHSGEKAIFIYPSTPAGTAVRYQVEWVAINPSKESGK